MGLPTVPPPPVRKDGVRPHLVSEWVIEQRITYLAELREMLKEARGHGRNAIEPIEVRITHVCDSIEKDLGLAVKENGDG